MAIEFSIGQKTAGTKVEGQDLQSSNLQTTTTSAKPILGGENVKVSSGEMTDLEKLVAQLKNESEDTRQSVAHRRLAILGTVLDSMADSISETERKNILEIESLNGQKSELQKELAGQLSDKSNCEGRISALDLKIEALEKAIEQAVKDGEDHRKQVEELKKKRSEEQQELDRIETAIKSANAKISGIDVKIAECTKAIGAATLGKVAEALRVATSETSPQAERKESNADRIKEEKKEVALNIENIISDALDELDDQIRKTLEEAQVVKA